MANISKRILSVAALATLAITSIGCGSSTYALSHDDAVTEMDALLKRVSVHTVQNPTLDIYSDVSTAAALADISTFPITEQGTGQINLEIAAPSEISGEAPDDWLNVLAREFNDRNGRINGKTVSVTVRKISSGEAVTYMAAGAYRPHLYIPSNYALGLMLDASGVQTVKLTDRLLGNTAGILMKKDVYDGFIEKYGEASMKNVLDAANAGDISFAYTNPYTSATGLNILASMLAAFDPSDPLSDTASQALLEYQKTAPPVAYTTGVLRNSAKKGLINAMVMEEQAYINTPELRGYEYIPAGIRHDHPVYAFGWDAEEEIEAAKSFVDYCLSADAQRLGTEKGFNRNDTYQGTDPGLSGTGYLSAQSIWKENKSGGAPIAAVFICDTSGSMNGEPINSLKSSLVAASSYIGSEHYIGLVSYSNSVTVNLPIAQFDDRQRAYFSGEVKQLTAGGGTATYDATLQALRMLEDIKATVPDAKPMIFLLTDGEQNGGVSLSRITGIVGGLQVPVYSIAYNYSDNGELEKLSNINESAVIKANTDDVVNQLRNLFNVEM